MRLSASPFKAYALIDQGNRLALFSGKVPIYWLRKVAQREADECNSNGFTVHVERIEIHREAKKREGK